jgi:YebC/PmpR family DNA-binding regulatory protein
MAGHSKWHNIRIRKGKQDALRSKLFTKLTREIMVAARLGGGNPDANPRLRLAIEKAREHHMPAENIKRAIQKGTGELEGVTYEEITYEGYGPGGVAIMAVPDRQPQPHGCRAAPPVLQARGQPWRGGQRCMAIQAAGRDYYPC